MEIALVPITTAGDRDRTKPFGQIGARGVFVKELEDFWGTKAGTLDAALARVFDGVLQEIATQSAALCRRAVDGRGADPQPFGYISQAQQPIAQIAVIQHELPVCDGEAVDIAQHRFEIGLIAVDHRWQVKPRASAPVLAARP